MTTFDEREKAFEDKYKHDQELQFKVTVRRNKLLGLWLAEMLGLSRDNVETVVSGQLAGKGEEILQTSLKTLEVGRDAAGAFERRPLPSRGGTGAGHWIITGNQATTGTTDKDARRTGQQATNNGTNTEATGLLD